MNTIIGIAGRAGSGKDTVADRMVQDHAFRKMSMARPLKDGMAAMGFPEPANRDDKERLIPGFTFTWRQAAQKLGTEWGRGLDGEIWTKVMERILLTLSGPVVISDIRFDNEADMIRGMGGKILHLSGRQADLGGAAAHASEAGVTVLPSQDAMIDNSGDLDDTMRQIYHYLGYTK